MKRKFFKVITLVILCATFLPLSLYAEGEYSPNYEYTEFDEYGYAELKVDGGDIYYIDAIIEEPYYDGYQKEEAAEEFYEESVNADFVKYQNSRDIFCDATIHPEIKNLVIVDLFDESAGFWTVKYFAEDKIYSYTQDKKRWDSPLYLEPAEKFIGIEIFNGRDHINNIESFVSEYGLGNPESEEVSTPEEDGSDKINLKDANTQDMTTTNEGDTGYKNIDASTHASEKMIKAMEIILLSVQLIFLFLAIILLIVSAVKKTISSYYFLGLTAFLGFGSMLSKPSYSSSAWEGLFSIFLTCIISALIFVLYNFLVKITYKMTKWDPNVDKSFSILMSTTSSYMNLIPFLIMAYFSSLFMSSSAAMPFAAAGITLASTAAGFKMTENGCKSKYMVIPLSILVLLLNGAWSLILSIL